MKKIIIAMFLISLPFSAHAESCQEFAGTMTKKILNIFHDTTKSEQQKRTVLTDIFQDAVDTNWIGKFVLGHYWGQATPEEQAEYLRNYRSYITNIYISKFKDEDGMSIDNIKLDGTKSVNDDEFEAKTLIQSQGDPDVKVDYLLKQNAGKCQVHDIKVEGVSLLASQRSEFSALAGKSGVKGIIEALHRQNRS